MPLGLVLIAALATPPAAVDERRLSPAEVERILDEAARKRVAAEKAQPRVIEGEVGVTIGTGGTREVFGTAVVPVGQQGTAIISIDTGESRRNTTRRRAIPR